MTNPHNPMGTFEEYERWQAWEAAHRTVRTHSSTPWDKPATQNGGRTTIRKPPTKAEIKADLRAREEARAELEAERRPPVRWPELLTLRERLARPRPPLRYRINGWQPVRSRVVLAAQFKAGKTTLTGNLARSLVDGDLWLDVFTVEPITGTLVMLDFEMSGTQLDEWLGDQQIRDDHRVIPVPMRGNASAFDIIDAGYRAEWAARLQELGCGYLVLDCLRPVLDRLGLDENRDAGRFLVAFDTLLAEAHVDEAMIVHHMGHAGERARGDSRIRDWPDAEWRLVRQDEDPASARFISGYGRDVDMHETQLAYDPSIRHLRIAGGSRAEATARAALADVLALLAEQPQQSGRAIEKAMSGSDHTQKMIRAAIKLGIRQGSIRTESGARGAVLHSKCVSASDRVASALTNSSECVSALLDDALHSDPADDMSASAALADDGGA